MHGQCFFSLFFFKTHVTSNAGIKRRDTDHQWLKSHHMSNTSRRTSTVKLSEISCKDLKGKILSLEWRKTLICAIIWTSVQRREENPTHRTTECTLVSNLISCTTAFVLSVQSYLIPNIVCCFHRLITSFNYFIDKPVNLSTWLFFCFCGIFSMVVFVYKAA